MQCMFHSYFDKCKEVFPYVNGHGFNIMDNEKNHSMKHGGNDIAKYGDLINMSCDTPEEAHKYWIKEPGGCTNQGPRAALTMMNHALRKEASALLHRRAFLCTLGPKCAQVCSLHTWTKCAQAFRHTVHTWSRNN